MSTFQFMYPESQRRLSQLEHVYGPLPIKYRLTVDFDDMPILLLDGTAQKNVFEDLRSKLNNEKMLSLTGLTTERLPALKSTVELDISDEQSLLSVMEPIDKKDISEATRVERNLTRKLNRFFRKVCSKSRDPGNIVVDLFFVKPEMLERACEFSQFTHRLVYETGFLLFAAGCYHTAYVNCDEISVGIMPSFDAEDGFSLEQRYDPWQAAFEKWRMFGFKGFLFNYLDKKKIWSKATCLKDLARVEAATATTRGSDHNKDGASGDESYRASDDDASGDESESDGNASDDDASNDESESYDVSEASEASEAVGYIDGEESGLDQLEKDEDIEGDDLEESCNLRSETESPDRSFIQQSNRGDDNGDGNDEEDECLYGDNFVQSHVGVESEPAPRQYKKLRRTCELRQDSDTILGKRDFEGHSMAHTADHPDADMDGADEDDEDDDDGDHRDHRDGNPGTRKYVKYH